jgi:hypothetical protein
MDLLKKAKALVDQIQLDDTGMMVGQVWVGGNGGMLSRDTIVMADDLRREIRDEETRRASAEAAK